MKRLIIIALVVFIGIPKAFATAQIPDVIIYEGKEYKLHSNPLESYFEKFPDKRPLNGIRPTSLWRGYVAIFEIKDSVMILKDIEIMVSVKDEKEEDGYGWESVRKESFSGQEDLRIDWFTGILVLPHGEMKNYVHMGYGSAYSNYILLEMESGKLKAEKKLDYEQYEEFKQKQFEAFKKTEEYKKLVTDLEKEGNSEEFIDSFLKSYIISYTSKFLDK